MLKIFKSRYSSLLFIFLCGGLGLFVMTAPTGCGGGGGGGDGSGTIQGNAFFQAGALSLAKDSGDSPLPGLQICGLGSCDTTDVNGAYSLPFDANSFTGGPVLFSLTLNGTSVNLTTDIPANSPLIILNFNQAVDGSFSTELISTSPTVVPTIDPTEQFAATPTSSVEPTTGPVIRATSTPDPTDTPDIDPTSGSGGSSGCATLSGTYIGSGTCGILSTSASASGSTVTFSPFGENSSTQFLINGTSGTSVSDDLIILEQSGHTCTISCRTAPGSFSLTCTNANGGRCSTTFNAP